MSAALRAIGLATVAALALAASGCGSGQSGSSTHSASASTKTNPNPFILIDVRNDTAAPVVFSQCKATCDELHERRPIPAHGATLILGLNEGKQFADLVENSAGKRLGCVYMKFDHVLARPVVLVSSMTSCK